MGQFSMTISAVAGSVLSDNQQGSHQTTGRLARIIDHLGSHGNNQDVEATAVEDALGFELRRYGNDLESNWDLMMLGYSYQKGGRGRGNSARFIYNKGHDKT